ncbi:MAG TPA: hypothetical protein VGG33_21865 [Polyangia bacterium]
MLAPRALPDRGPLPPAHPRQICPKSVVARAGLIVCTAILATACARATPSAPLEPENLLERRAPFRSTHAHRTDRLTDAVRAHDGSAWDHDLSTVVRQGGGVEWDLGTVQYVRAVYLQADHNDDYVLMVSPDGEAWADAWTAPRITAAGLQGRHSDKLDARARFVRIEPRAGDSAYSLTEVALYAQVPRTWPPNVTEGVGIPESVREQRVLAIALVCAGLLALLGVVSLTVASARRRGADPMRADTRLRAPTGWRDPRPWLVLLAAGLLVVTASLARARYQFNTIDDAYISFQYAKNWASGHGVVFNLGERVEGYTNFLWVALLAPLWPLVGRDPVAFTAAASHLTMALACLALVFVALIGKRALRNPLAWLLALLTLAFDDAFIMYTVFALENQLLVVCVLVGLHAFVRRGRHWDLVLGASFAAVAMTRPDGVLWAGTFFAAELAARLGRRMGWCRQDRAPQIPLSQYLRIAGVFVALYGVYFAWRFSYYGYLFPNTFYLKVGHSLAGLQRGWDYLQSYVVERRGVPLLALAGFAAVSRPWVRWVGLYAVIHAAYVVYVGGDFYSGHRFLMVLTPLLGLLAAAGIDQVLQLRHVHPSTNTAVAGAVLAAVLLLRWGTLVGGPAALEIAPWSDVVNQNVRQMRWLAPRVRPSASMVLGDIGGAGFFASLRVIDVFGVVDPKVAHREVAGFGTGKAGHEKVATTEELLTETPTYIRWGFVDPAVIPQSYYLFNDFPPDLHLPGLFVRDDRDGGHLVAGSRFSCEPEELRLWTRAGGDAFDAAIAGPARNQGPRPGIVGNRGAFIDTMSAPGGDRATGRLLSPPFPIEGDQIRLRVGGGRDPQRLRVSLLVDGHAVVSATGTNAETLGRRVWDVAAWKGRSARIEIVDQATEAWGHILVDEIEQRSGGTAPGTASAL